MGKLRNSVPATIMLLTLGLFLCSSAYAGSAIVGSVAGSVNASVGGQELLANATIFSGDNLQVRDGVAVINLGRGSRLVFGRESTVSFAREADAVTAVMGQGNVSLFSPEGGSAVRVKVGEVTVAAAKGFKTLGEVAMTNGTVSVTTKEGMLRVEGDGQAVDVAKGKTIAVVRKAAGAPQAGGGAHGGGHVLQFLSLGAGVTAAGLAAWAIHDSNSSKDQANAATAAANAAQQAAQNAAAAALAAQNSAVAAGCALNRVAHQVGMLTSPFTPPAGYPPC